MTAPTLRDLFKERDDLYEHYSKKLLESITHITAAVEEIISEDESKKLEWASVSLVGTVVVALGTVKYPIGHEIQLPTGEKLIIDEDYQELTASAIRVGVPYQFAAVQDKEKVKEYLMKNLEVPPTHLSKEAKAEKLNVIQDMVEPSEQQDFNMNDLTEEQIQQIMFHMSHTSSGSSH